MFLNVFKCRSDFEICFQPVPVSDYCGPYATPESLHQLAGNLIWMIIFDKEQERTKFNDKIFLLLLNTMCSCDNPSWWEKNSAAPVTDAAESLRTQLDRHLRSWSQLVWWWWWWWWWWWSWWWWWQRWPARAMHPFALPPHEWFVLLLLDGFHLMFCLFVVISLRLPVSLPGNRLVPIDFGRRKLAKTELSPQPRNTYQVDHSFNLLAHL